MLGFLYLLRGVLAFLGKVFGQALNGRRELDNRRRELRVQFLVDAWRNLQRAARRADGDEGRLDQALADIQLFGTPSQAEKAATLARSINELRSDTTTLDDLLEVLRADLRDELRLGRANTRLVYLRGEEARIPIEPSAPRQVCLLDARAHAAARANKSSRSRVLRVIAAAPSNSTRA
jgi:hypothetical protein